MIKLSENARILLSLFLPIYAIHCMEQVYFVFGNVVQSYGVSPETTGWLLGSFFVAIMAMRPIGGWMLENLGIRRTLVFASIVGFIGCMILFFARGTFPLFLGRILSGASFGIYSMGVYSYQAVVMPEEMRGAAFAIIASGGMLPMATATPLGEWFLLQGYTNLYLAVGPVMCILCWYFGRRAGAAEISVKKESEVWGNYRDLASKPFLVLLATGVIVSLIDATTVIMSLFAADRGIPASYFLASSAVSAVLVRVAGAKTLNALPRSAMFALCGMLMAGALCFISIMPANTTFIIGGLAFGVGIGAAFPMYLALVSDTLPKLLRPKGTGTALLLYDSGWFFTPLLVGYTTSLVGIAWTLRTLSITTFVILTLLQFFFWIPIYRNKKRIGSV